jgi:DNA-binding beta-propeller fold protein YncE
VNATGNVTKLLANTGAVVGTYPAGIQPPYGVAFDGTNIWVTNTLSNTVTKLLASSGAAVGTYSAGYGPYGIAFDGTNIWVARGRSSAPILWEPSPTV